MRPRLSVTSAAPPLGKGAGQIGRASGFLATPPCLSFAALRGVLESMRVSRIGRASAGFRPGRRVTFFVRTKKVTKENHPASSPRCARSPALLRKTAWLRNSPFSGAARQNGAQTVLAIPLRGHAIFLPLLGDAEGEYGVTVSPLVAKARYRAASGAALLRDCSEAITTASASFACSASLRGSSCAPNPTARDRTPSRPRCCAGSPHRRP